MAFEGIGAAIALEQGERWGREWLGRPVPEERPGDWRRYFAFTLDQKAQHRDEKKMQPSPADLP